MTDLPVRSASAHSVAEDTLAVVSPPGPKQTAVYVYETPVRIWHWLNALCLIVLFVSGYFIGAPPPTLSGEASDHFFFGYIRMAHFAAGQVLIVLFVMRVFWAFRGNHHARQLFYLPLFRGRWWAEMWHEIKWYLFLTRTPKKYVGHNPLATLAMFVLFLLPLMFMMLTGGALYAEGALAGSWWDTVFGWIIPLLGGSMQVHTLHRLGMWVLIGFAMIHVYVAIREDIMSRQSLISTMISGWRTFKDDKP